MALKGSRDFGLLQRKFQRKFAKNSTQRRISTKFTETSVEGLLIDCAKNHLKVSIRRESNEFFYMKSRDFFKDNFKENSLEIQLNVGFQ